MKASDIELRVREQLSGAVWAPAFERRTVTRRYGRIWIVHPGADLNDGGPWIYADTLGRVRRVDFVGPTQRLLRVGAVIVLLVGVVLLVTRFYPTHWCGTEMTRDGRRITICRDPQLTDPAVVALGLLVVAALGVFYTEISGFGLTMKRRVEAADNNARSSLELIEELQRVRDLSQETQADLADANLRTAARLDAIQRSLAELRFRIAAVGDRTASASAESEAAEPNLAEAATEDPAAIVEDNSVSGGVEFLDPEMIALATTYDAIRSTMVAGPERSARMEAIFLAMRKASSGEQRVTRSDVQHLLAADSSRGARLVGYAHLMEHPVTDMAPLVVTAAAAEDKPFGQYCALRAIGEILDALPTQLPAGLVEQLTKVSLKAGRGTDRARQVASILASNTAKPTGAT